MGSQRSLSRSASARAEPGGARGAPRRRAPPASARAAAGAARAPRGCAPLRPSGGSPPPHAPPPAPSTAPPRACAPWQARCARRSAPRPLRRVPRGGTQPRQRAPRAPWPTRAPRRHAPPRRASPRRAASAGPPRRSWRSRAPRPGGRAGEGGGVWGGLREAQTAAAACLRCDPLLVALGRRIPHRQALGEGCEGPPVLLRLLGRPPQRCLLCREIRPRGAARLEGSKRF